MADATLTAGSPFPRRLAAYLLERFPPLGNGLLIVTYVSSNHFLARAVTAPGEPVGWDPHALLAMGCLLLFFFHLRVFDEHKDFAADSRHHPQRVLQRGLVTLRHLRWLGAAAIAAQVVLALLASSAAVVAWVLAFAWSVLMLREFFVGTWLRARFLLYSVLHLLVMPLLSLLVFSFTTARPPWQAPPLFLLYSLVGFFVTFNWEVSRKIRAPEEEIEGVDTYTRRFGTYGAGWIVLLLRAADTALVAAVGAALRLPAWFYLALVLLFLLTTVGFAHYRLRTTPRTARRMETWAGVYVIAFDVVLAAALAARYGLEWPW